MPGPGSERELTNEADGYIKCPFFLVLAETPRRKKRGEVFNNSFSLTPVVHDVTTDTNVLTDITHRGHQNSHAPNRE